MPDTRPIAVTAGEPAGIGPDLCIELSRHPLNARVVVVADHDLLAERARLLRLEVELLDFDPARPQAPGRP